VESEIPIVWTKTAKSDLKEIISYIAEDSVKIALEKSDLIEDRVASLRFNPDIGRKIPELEEYNDMAYKEIVVYPWRVVYQVKTGKLFVLMVLDGRRNLQDILFKRLMRN
jgi:toxin ParE1/3/4